MTKCYKCDELCIQKEDKSSLFGFPCDICQRLVCKNCTGLMASEIRVVPSASRVLLHVCPDCRGYPSMVPKLLKRIDFLESEIKLVQKELENQRESWAREVEEIKRSLNVDPDRGVPDEQTSANKPSLIMSSGDSTATLPEFITGLKEEILQGLNTQTATIESHLSRVVVNIMSANKDLVRLLTDGEATNVDQGILQKINREQVARPSENTLVAKSSISAGTKTYKASLKPPIKLKAANIPVRNVNRNVNKNGTPSTQQPRSLLPNTNSRLESASPSASERMIIGTGTVNGPFSAGERRQWIYLGRCDPTTTENNITDYMNQQLGISDVKCFILDRNEDVVSFKIGVKESLLRGLLEPNLWPTGTAVKEFREFRTRRPLNNVKSTNFQRRNLGVSQT